MAIFLAASSGQHMDTVVASIDTRSDSQENGRMVGGNTKAPLHMGTVEDYYS